MDSLSPENVHQWTDEDLILFLKRWDEVLTDFTKENFKFFCSFCELKPKSSATSSNNPSNNNRTFYFSPDRWFDEQKQLLAGLSKWDIILKARQVGFSSLGMMRVLYYSLTHPNSLSVVLVQDKANKTTQMNAIRLALNSLEHFGKQIGYKLIPDRDYDSVDRVQFKYPHSALIRFDVAAKDELNAETAGRGSHIDYFHITELSKFKVADAVLGPYLQQVDTDDYLVIESTPDGPDGAFYNLWQAAKSGKNSYKPHFFSWFAHQNYKTPIPNDIEPDELEPKNSWEELLIKNGGTKENLLFWRTVIVNDKCSGDINYALQEYPIDDWTCFRARRSAFFSIEDLEHHRLHLKKPKLHRGWQPDPVRVYEEPSPIKRYVLGADVASGDGRGDHNAFVILDVEDSTVVAAFNSNRISFDSYPSLLIEWAGRYNGALVSIERQNLGFAVIKGVTKIGTTQVYTDKDGKLGFNTTAQSRPLMDSNLISEVKSKNITINDEELLSQIQSLKIDEKDKLVASSGHDDLVMAFSIALMTRRRNLVRGHPAKPIAPDVSTWGEIQAPVLRNPADKDYWGQW